MDALLVVYIAMGSVLFGVLLGIPIGGKMYYKQGKNKAEEMLDNLPDALKVPAEALKDVLGNIDKKKAGKFLKNFGIKTKVREKRGRRK